MRSLLSGAVVLVTGALVVACGGSDEGNLFPGTGGAAGASGGGTGGGGTGGGGTGGGGTGAGGTGGTGVGASGGTGGAGTGGGGTGGGGTGGGGTGGGGTGGGGTGGGGTGGGGTGGGGTGGGGTGGVVGKEDCTNGVDDNADQLADCQDPQCQGGFTCAVTPPSGWQGVGWLDKQAGVACPDGFAAAVQLFEVSSLIAPPASCGCGCGTPSNVFCRANMACSSGNSCSSSGGTLSSVASCSTVPVPNPGGSNACLITEIDTTVGSCTASVSTAIAAPSWPATTRTCSTAVAGACAAAGQACVPKLPGAVGPCVAQPGDLACPAGTPYTQKTLYFNGQVADTRGCSVAGCSCGGSQGSACECTGGTCGVAIHTTNTCGSGYIGFVSSSGACALINDNNNLDSNWGAARLGMSVTNAGTCPPSGSGTPTGEVSPTGPITVCCVP